MEDLFAALANPLRLRALKELLRSPECRHGELLSALELPRSKAPALTKALDPLETAGLVLRTSGKYRVVDQSVVTRLLVAGADLDVIAKRQILKRAQDAIPKAEQAAAELRQNLGQDSTDKG